MKETVGVAGHYGQVYRSPALASQWLEETVGVVGRKKFESDDRVVPVTA